MTEVKYDGFRTMAYAEGREATLVSRNGHVFSSRTYEPVRAAVAALGADVILDGELVCLDPDGMPVFNPLMWRRGTVYFHVFDCLWLNGSLSKLPLLVRKQILRRLISGGTGRWC